MRIQKKHWIIIALIFVFFLGAEVYNYGRALREINEASAVTVGTPNPGHTWAQMECNANSLCIDTTNNLVGIGTNTPLFKEHIAADVTMNADITAGTAQLSVGGSSVIGKRMLLGYDTNGNGYGFIKAGNYGVTWTPLSLQPNGGNVGIGTTTPAQKLEVNGNILASGTGDVCNGGGKCLSSVFQTNVIAGANPVCPTGQTAIMRAYNGTWYVPSQVTTWSQVSCGQVMSSDGTTLLVNSQHTSKNCTDVGGTVVGDGNGNNMCRFNLNACPNSWQLYQGWTTTGEGCGGCGGNYHAWSNNATQENPVWREYVCGISWPGCLCANSSDCSYTCTVQTCGVAPRTQVGCY